MFKRSMFSFLAAGMLFSSYCLVSPPAYGEPVGGYAVGDCGGCGNCADCLGTYSNPYGRPCFPLIQNMYQYFSRLHHCMRSAGCGAGCGPVYTDEWRSDPPGCSSCDRHGNWTGGHSGVYQAPYEVSPHMQPEPTAAPQPTASRTSYRQSRRPSRHPGRIAVGI